MKHSRTLFIYSFILYNLVIVGCGRGDLSSNKTPSNENEHQQKSPLYINTKNFELYPGESFKLSVFGGIPPYAYENKNNFFDAVKSIFKLPIATEITADSINVKDSTGQSIDINIKVKNFNFYKEIPGIVRSNYSAVVIRESEVDSINNIYAVGSSGHLIPTGTSNTSISNYSHIFKSSDQGITWTTLYSAMEIHTQVMSLSIDKIKNHIYMLEKSWLNQKQVFYIKKSIDNGIYWQILSTFSADSYNLEKIKYTSLGNLLLTGVFINDWGFTKAIVLKSIDKGQMWTQLGEISSDINLIEKLTISAPSIVEYNNTTYFLMVNSDTYNSNPTQPSLWKVKKTTNNGATWVDSDDFNIVANKDRVGSSITLLENGNLISIGHAFETTSISKCIVRSSTDLGETWTTIDSYNYGASTTCSAKGVAAIGNTITYHAETNGRRVLRSGASSFTTTDDLAISSFSSGILNSLVADSNNNIYMITNSSVTIVLYSSYYYKLSVYKKPPGQTLTLIYNQNWDKLFKSTGRMLENEFSELIESYQDSTNKIITTVSLDQAQSWSQIETYSYNSTATHIKSLSFDNNKNLIMTAKGGGHWIARKGQRISPTVYNWQTIDDLQINPNNNTPTGIAINSQNEIFVVGYTKTTSNVASWIVRKSDSTGLNFTTIDTLSFGTKYCDPISIKINKKDEIFVYGTVALTSNMPDAYIIRRSIDNGITWQTIKTIKSDYLPSKFEIDSNDEMFLVGVSNNYLIVERGTSDGNFWKREGVIKLQELSEPDTISDVKIFDNTIIIPVNSEFYFNSQTVNNKTNIYLFKIKNKNLFHMSSHSNVFNFNIFDCRQLTICFYGNINLGSGNNGSYVRGLEK